MASDPITLTTDRLLLVGATLREAREMVEGLSEEHRHQFSEAWIEGLANANEGEPWYPGFKIQSRVTGEDFGQCAFKGKPDANGCVEIAYMIEDDHQKMGYATEAAIALSEFAFSTPSVNTVVAHTLPNRNASTRVLEKSGFELAGEHTDPEDGLVWRWTQQRHEFNAES